MAYVWRIERFQIDTIKFERTKIHFFSDVVTAVVVALLKVPILFVAQPPYPLPQYVEVKLSEGLNGLVALTVNI